MQIDQGCDADPRWAEFHPRARGSIQHPRRQGDNYAKGNLDMYDITAGTALDVLRPKPVSEQWMPRIEDLDFLPDMGRMTP